MLESGQKKRERVARTILDQPTITHSAKRTIRGDTSEYSQTRSPFRDELLSNTDATSPLRLNVVEDSDSLITHP